MSDPGVIEVAGRRLQVSIEGSGPPLLLINGLGGTTRTWEPLRSELVGRRTLTFDLPGAGGSPAPRVPISIPGLARLTARLLEALDEREVDVLGFSLGGLIAAQLAWTSPARVRRLVLMSTNAGWGSMPGRPRAFGHLFSLARLSDPEAFARAAPALLGGRMRTDPALVRRAAASRVADPQSVRGYLCQLASCASWSTAPFLPLVRQPTLVVVGDDDPLARPFNARWMSRLIPGGRLHVVRGGGHYLVLERPAEIAAIVDDFLGGDIGEEHGSATDGDAIWPRAMS